MSIFTIQPIFRSDVVLAVNNINNDRCGLEHFKCPLHPIACKGGMSLPSSMEELSLGRYSLHPAPVKGCHRGWEDWTPRGCR
jgi:hypothetical protein